MKNWFSTLLSGTDGSPSTMRVLAFMVIGFLLGKNLYLTVHTGTAVPMDWQEVSLIVGTLAMKAAQTKAEQPVANGVNPPALSSGQPAQPKVP